MKSIALFLIFVISSWNNYAQTSRVERFIFIPHPRNENKTVQGSLPAIEQIDFQKFDMILLGGDLAYYTSMNSVSLNHLDSIFNLGSPATLLTYGNHDLSNIPLLQKYTGRPAYYAMQKEGICFLVLNTEQQASGFKSSFITGDQLQMVKNVCDTISGSDFLMVLHHRLLWMIGNPDFDSRIDSVGESTRQLDTTNFYQELFPWLQKVKSRGIQVFCLGGDKSRTNIAYSPEDSIWFFASTMAPEYADSVNDVMVFSYLPEARTIHWEFVSLSAIEKKKDPVLVPKEFAYDPEFRCWQPAGSQKLNIQAVLQSDSPATLKIFSLHGILLHVKVIRKGEFVSFAFHQSGVYIMQVDTKEGIFYRKLFIK